MDIRIIAASELNPDPKQNKKIKKEIKSQVRSSQLHDLISLLLFSAVASWLRYDLRS